MNEVKLKKVARKELNEIFQSIDIKFSLLHQKKEDEYEQVCVEGKCRDFLSDYLWSKHFGKRASIYGLSYNYEDHPFDSDKLKISMNFPDVSSKENFISHVESFIHKKEKKAKLNTLTEVFSVKGNKEMLVVVADKAWLKSPWRLSLYSYYLKVASYENEEELLHPEREYKQQLTNYAETKLLRNIKTAPEIFLEDLHSSHNRSGFYSLITNVSDDGWYGTNKDWDVIFGGKNV